jgi:hypothetical protein
VLDKTALHILLMGKTGLNEHRHLKNTLLDIKILRSVGATNAASFLGV